MQQPSDQPPGIVPPPPPPVASFDAGAVETAVREGRDVSWNDARQYEMAMTPEARAPANKAGCHTCAGGLCCFYNVDCGGNCLCPLGCFAGLPTPICICFGACLMGPDDGHLLPIEIGGVRAVTPHLQAA